MIYRNRSEDNLNDLSWAFPYLENGQRPFDRSAVFHSNPNMYMHSLWFERFGFWRRTPVSAWADPAEQISLLTRIRPNIIRGNPSDLLRLVSTIERERVQGVNPRLVFTNGAFLDKQFRRLVESVFGAEVFDFYGTAELGCIGWECSRHEGYHINTDSVVLEVVDAQGHAVSPGERGKIVCTGLIANTMPFIRYYTGDIGVLSDRPCPCGRGLPLLTRLEGRANQFLILSDGTEVSPNLIMQLIKRIQGIQQFKVVQEDVTRVKVDVVPDKRWGAESFATLRNVLETITHHCAMIEIALVDEMPQNPSKKFQSIMSRIERGG
jgi:phenylacetate-CoA ligase